MMIALLLGCATSHNSHESAGTQLAPDLFQVVFRAQPYESAEKAHDLALLKAANLVQAHGFAAFEVVNEIISPLAEGAKSPGTALSSGYIQPDAGGAYFTGHTTCAPDRIYDSQGLSTQLLVRGIQGKPEHLTSLDVSSVQRAIRQKYHLE